MADTDTETQPLPNGNAALTEEEEERMKQRPADIDADVREMERRKRVEALMSSKLFREELERVLDQQMHEGGDAPLLQRIREMVGGRLHAGNFRGPSCVLPINDIRGIEGIGYEKGEKILRCKLAALYRLVDLFGWTQTGLQGQITGRLNTAEESVLTTPRGLLPHEVTASSLVKVDMQGIVQDQGTTNFPVNIEGFSWHASVHAARPDVRCVVHVRAAPALAVSSTRSGLLPLCHEAALLGELAYHTMPFGNLDNAERDKLVRALGPSAKVLMVSGCGALCCGGTVEEAFQLARCLVAACDVQLKLAAVPADQLQLIEPHMLHQLYEASRKPPAEGGKWRVGGEEFEALMRMLDNAGFRTGYIYRHPLIKNDVPRPKNDVELPPAVSSLGYLLEEEELYRQGIWKKGQGKTGERTRWLNSPNVYQKVEVLETGTNDPKKITKWVDANNEEWVQDGSPKHSSTPVKIDTLQFVPKNTNPKEFKALQQQIKDNRRADKISAGPVSHILEGVTWDEAGRLMAEDAHNTHTGDHVVLMGAASKGIIQRDYQHNASVYAAPYARNPFEHVTDSDLAHYADVVQRRHNNHYDTDISESEALSAAQLTSPASNTGTEDESRDEHRVLRIETKQAPVRSQPEVVLSDVDTTDNFLSVERAHADRSKGTNLSPEAKARLEAMSVNKKNKHDYTRANNFEITIKKFESPDNSGTDSKKQPKCKVSLSSRMNESVRDNALAVYNSDLISSRSSLYSIPSIEWDAKFKPEYALRTQSLPRAKKIDNNRLYRTRSHSGFINSFIKDPEPNHFHVPKCKVCGSNNNSYAWQLSLDRKIRKCRTQKFYSVDNLPQKCIEEGKMELLQVKIQDPMFKVENNDDNEFVESQEFSEDNYFGEFSEHQTVIESLSPKVTNYDFSKEVTNESSKNNATENNKDEQLYRAVLVNTDDIVNTSNEGEYHSFTDEMDFETSVYESPVKDLVEKDIRDYSVPINFYCEDYAKKDDSPRKSPPKRRELMKPNVLEPILEESKSSTGEESTISSSDINLTKYDISDNGLRTCIMVSELVDNIVHDVLDKSKVTQLETPILNDNANLTDNKKDSENTLDNEFTVVNAATEILEDCLFEKVETLNIPEAMTIISTYENETHFDIVAKTRVSSIEFNSLSSTSAVHSFDSTAEFEKYEVITDVISYIMRRIDFADASNNNTQAKPNEFRKPENIINAKVLEIDQPNVSLVCTAVIPQCETDSQLSDELSVTEFSIATMVTEIDTKANVINDTILTESTESDTSFNHKIIESVVYYVFDRVFVCLAEKNKRNRKKRGKKVITVVDAEDILYTSNLFWGGVDLSRRFEDDENNCNKVVEVDLNSDLEMKENEEYTKETKENHQAIEIEHCLNSELNKIDSKDKYCLNPDEETRTEERQSINKRHSYIQEVDDDETVFSANIVTSEVVDHLGVFVDLTNESNIKERQDLDSSDDTLEVASEIISDLLERSVIDIDCSLQCEHCSDDNEKGSAVIENLSNETFVIDPRDHEDMNTAFVEDEHYLSRSSSPKCSTAFEACTESPIKRNCLTQDLSIYEKENAIFGSPFLKKASVISMSQTEQPGGVKYWLSFDNSLQDTEKPAPKLRNKYEDNKIPSFVTFKCDKYTVYEKEKRRSSVLLDDYNPTVDDNMVDNTMNSSFTEYNTCESDQINAKLDETSCQKKLIYDSRIDLHRGRKTRRYNSWPPFEDTLFYKLISKFRMSESFDPSDLDTSRADVSY